MTRLATAALTIATLLAVLATGLSSVGAVVHDTFATTPFDPRGPRWCERYHHGHYVRGAVRLTRSRAATSECQSGGRAALSCREPGCDPCGVNAGSPCAKVGDPLGNAVVQTVRDDPGRRRTVTARFRIERRLPIDDSHLAIYAALHPHCHTTAQAILVPDRPGVYHLNLAVINAFIGGDPERYRVCSANRMHEISPPLAADIALREGVAYTWTLATELDAAGHVVASCTVSDAHGTILADGRYTFTSGVARAWFGVAGAGARYGFGAQFGRGASPSGGDPVILLLDFDGRSR